VIGPPTVRAALATLAAASLAAARADAQAEPVARWERVVEVSGTVSFGNNPQTLVTTQTGITHNDSALTVRSDLRLLYGQAATEDRGSEVTRRTWLGTVGADWYPYEKYSPFVLGSYESSFERRVRSRINAGAGGKVTVVRTPETRLDFSVALLAERSALPDDSGAVHTEGLARWSGRIRYRRAFDNRLNVDHVTFYRPEVAAVERFTVTSNSSLGYEISRTSQLQVSFLDNYDSGARGRGARSNNDGQLVVGVLTMF